MEAGDRDEVRQAGGAQRGPIAFAEIARVAEGECADEAIARARDGGIDAIGHAGAPSVQAGRRRQDSRGSGIAHVARRGDALREGVAFGVERARVAQAARRAQAHVEMPTATGRGARAGGGVARVVPGQADETATQCFGLVARIIDAQVESHAAWFGDGKIDDAAGNAGVGACERVRWRCERDVRVDAGEQRAGECDRATSHRENTARLPAPRHANECGDCKRNADPDPRGQQHRQPETGQRTAGEQHRHGDGPGRARRCAGDVRCGPPRHPCRIAHVTPRWVPVVAVGLRGVPARGPACAPGCGRASPARGWSSARG